MQVLLAGVRGYFWDFDRVTPFPVPSLLKSLPEDGSEVPAPTDPASEHADVHAAFAAGNLSLEVGAGPATITSGDLSDNPLEAADGPLGGTLGEAPGGSIRGSTLHTADSALHIEAVGVVELSTNTWHRTHMRDHMRDHPFVKQESNAAGDSFLSAISSLDHAGHLETVGSAFSNSGGAHRVSWSAPAADFQQVHAPDVSPAPSHQASPAAIVRGVFTDMSGDSGAISLPYPPP
jgi:hypothetical protein